MPRQKQTFPSPNTSAQITSSTEDYRKGHTTADTSEDERTTNSSKDSVAEEESFSSEDELQQQLQQLKPSVNISRLRSGNVPSHSYQSLCADVQRRKGIHSPDKPLDAVKQSSVNRRSAAIRDRKERLSSHVSSDANGFQLPQVVALLSQPHAHGRLLVGCFAALVLGAVLFVCFHWHSHAPLGAPASVDTAARLGKLFSYQNPRFRKTLSTVLKSVQKEPAQPAVVLIVSNATGSGRTDMKVPGDLQAACVANFLEKELTGKQAVNIEGTFYWGREDAASKADVDHLLETHFSASARVALITSIEKLGLETAKLFYRYCDHENSPYRNVIFILTLNMKGVITYDSIENALRDSWIAIPDEVAPIMTRIANNIVSLEDRPIDFHCVL